MSAENVTDPAVDSQGQHHQALYTAFNPDAAVAVGGPPVPGYSGFNLPVHSSPHPHPTLMGANIWTPVGIQTFQRLMSIFSNVCNQTSLGMFSSLYFTSS